MIPLISHTKKTNFIWVFASLLQLSSNTFNLGVGQAIPGHACGITTPFKIWDRLKKTSDYTKVRPCSLVLDSNSFNAQYASKLSRESS